MRTNDTKEDVIEKLHHQYAKAVFYKCVKMLGSRSEAEDAVQETFFKAYEKLDTFVDQGSRARLSWLYQIATFVCLHILRTRQRRGAEPLDNISETCLSTTNRSERDLHVQQLLERIVTQMDKRDQQIVVAHFIDGVPQDEVAEMLGISRRAVAKRIAGFRKRAAHMMKEEALDVVLS